VVVSTSILIQEKGAGSCSSPIAHVSRRQYRFLL
jgi:hypothetical protein